MLQEIEISFDVPCSGYQFSIEKVWRYRNKLYVLSQLDLSNNQDDGVDVLMRDKVSVDVGENPLSVRHFVMIKPWIADLKKLFRPSCYKATVIMDERNISDQVRSEGVCVYSRHQPLQIAVPPLRVKQNISVGLSVPFAGCDFHLLHVWEHEGRLIVTSRFDYLVGTGGIGSHWPHTFRENVSVNVLKEMPVEHYLITNRDSDNIQYTPLAGYQPQFLKRESDLPLEIIDKANCLFENDMSDSHFRVMTFIEEMLHVLRLRHLFLNKESEPFYNKMKTTTAFITFIVSCLRVQDALGRDEHSGGDKKYILFAGDAQHILEEAMKKDELNFDEYYDLIEKFGFDKIDQERLSALFKKYDKVYKKDEPYNGLTFFKKAAIISLGAATAALAGYALAGHK